MFNLDQMPVMTEYEGNFASWDDLYALLKKAENHGWVVEKYNENSPNPCYSSQTNYTFLSIKKIIGNDTFTFEFGFLNFFDLNRIRVKVNNAVKADLCSDFGIDQGDIIPQTGRLFASNSVLFFPNLILYLETNNLYFLYRANIEQIGNYWYNSGAESLKPLNAFIKHQDGNWYQANMIKMYGFVVNDNKVYRYPYYTDWKVQAFHNFYLNGLNSSTYGIPFGVPLFSPLPLTCPYSVGDQKYNPVIIPKGHLFTVDDKEWDGKIIEIGNYKLKIVRTFSVIKDPYSGKLYKIFHKFFSNVVIRIQ